MRFLKSRTRSSSRTRLVYVSSFAELLQLAFDLSDH